MGKLKFAIIGCGRISYKHVEAILHNENEAELVAVCDILEENALRRKEEYLKHYNANSEVKVFLDYKEMLSTEKLDAVFILTPPHLHGEIEKVCATHVPAVFIEKPVSNNLKTTFDIQEVFDSAGTIASVGYMMRYNPLVNRARTLFTESSEKPVLINGWWLAPLPGPIWWRTGSQSGGQFVEQCTHLVDAAIYIAGEITEVSAFVASGFMKNIVEYDTDDAMVVNFKVASGGIGNFTTGCFPQNNPDGSIGMVFSSLTKECRFDSWDMKLNIRHAAGQHEVISNSDIDIFELESRMFLQAVAERKPSLLRSTYNTAYETLKVTLAANEAASTGKVIKIG
jgi:predicted dehydrogenase